MFRVVVTIQRNNPNSCSSEYLREPSDRSNSIKAYLSLLTGSYGVSLGAAHRKAKRCGGCGCFLSSYSLPKGQDGHFGMVQDEVEPLARHVDVNARRARVPGQFSGSPTSRTNARNSRSLSAIE